MTRPFCTRFTGGASISFFNLCWGGWFSSGRYWLELPMARFGAAWYRRARPENVRISIRCGAATWVSLYIALLWHEKNMPGSTCRTILYLALILWRRWMPAPVAMSPRFSSIHVCMAKQLRHVSVFARGQHRQRKKGDFLRRRHSCRRAKGENSAGMACWDLYRCARAPARDMNSTRMVPGGLP